MDSRFGKVPITTTSAGKQPQTVAIIIIAFTVTIALLYFLGVFDEILPANPTPLSPAKNLEGTWKATFPVTFYIKTDFETFGELQDVDSEDRTMTWVITGPDNEAVVDAEVQFMVSNSQLISGSGYTPDVSSMFLKGIVSGTQLTPEIGDGGTIGEFNFTTDIITGTWSNHWSIVYEQQVYTANNSLILTRQ